MSLFAFCITSGDDDVLIDTFDFVLDAGVPDEAWEWISWRDQEGRIFALIKGSTAARGAFLSADGLRPIRLSVAERFATDSRSKWDEPRSAEDGRRIFNNWVSEPLVPQSEDVVVPTAPVQGAATNPMRRRATPEKLHKNLVPLERKPVAVAPNKQQSQPPAAKKSHGGFDQRGTKKSEPSAERKRQSQVLEAFGQTMMNKTDINGNKITLYRPKEVD